MSLESIKEKINRIKENVIIYNGPLVKTTF